MNFCVQVENMINLKSQEQEKIMTGLCENDKSLIDWLNEISKITWFKFE